MKRVLSFLMAVLLIVSLLPTNALHAHAAEESVTLDLSKSSNRISFSTTEQVWEQNGITLTNKKASSSSNVANYTPPRFYASSSLTIAFSGGNITKIAIACNNSSYANSLKNSVPSSDTATVSGSTTTITLTTPAPSYTISSLSAQVRAGNTVTVYYEAASCSHTDTTTTKVDATCTQAGSTTVTCDDCDKVISTAPIAALGHNYENGECTRCDATLPVVSFSVPEGVAAVGSLTADEDGNVKMPFADDYDGKYDYTFAGWVVDEVDNSDAQPATIYSANTSYKFTANTTLKALYTYEAEGAGASGWVQKDLASITSSDVVVITGTNSSGTYAMSNNNGTSSAPSAIKVTVSGTTLTDEEIADTIKWNVGGNATDGYIFYPNGSTSTWLYCTSTNNGVRVGTNAANTFKINASSNYLVHSGTSRYIGIYNSQDWRCYTSINTNIQNQTFKFYVQQTGTAILTYYTTIVEAGEDITCKHTSTTTTTVAATCTEAGSATVTCDDCGETVSTETIAATGHQNTTTTTVAATCTEAGSTTVTCDDCGAQISKTEITAPGHNYVNGACSVCGEKEPASSSERYYIAAMRTAGGKVYYMTNALTTSSTKRYVAESTTLTEVPAMIENPETDKVFVLEEVSTGVYVIYAEGITEDAKYLGHSSGNSGAFVTENNAKQLTLTCDDDGSVKINFGTRKLTLNNASGNDYFAWYESEQADVYLIPVGTPCEHTNTTNVAAVAATCTSVGYTAGVQCDDCGEYTDGHEEIPMVDHSYNSEITTAAGCTTTGVKTFTCSACGDSYTETIAATGHTPGEETRVEPDCTNTGKTSYTCTVCQTEVSVEIPALGHDWDEGTVITAATCETAGVMIYTCSRGCTKTEAIPATGHSYVNGVCSVCKKEISRFELVTDYTKILAGGEYIIAAKVGDTFYAINSGLDAEEVTVTGTGENIMVEYKEGLPIWNLEYFQNRNDCFSIYSPAAEKYLTGTISTSLTTDTTAWPWTFIDGSNANGEETDGTFAVTQDDGSVAFAVASAAVIDRAISLKGTTEFMNYSVRTAGYNRELYFFKMVEANETEYTINYVENGISYSKTIPVNENVELMPATLQNETMPEGYTKFAGWVKLPHAESLVAPTAVYAPSEEVVITEDTTFYALYTREDSSAEGQALSYHLVTDNNQLVQGQMYIIVGYDEETGKYYAMSKDQLSGDRGAAVVEPDANGVITFTPADNVATLQLTQGYVIDSFAFLDVAMNKFLYCASTTTENALKSEVEMSEKSSFVITIVTDADGTYSTIQSQVTGTTRTNLAYNTISDHSGTFIFSCYDPTVTSVNIKQTYLYVGVVNSTSATYYTTGLCAHQWEVTETVEATCEHAGYTIKTCTICGEVQVTDVQAHGHNPGAYTVTSEPTCTTTGTQTAYCSNCNQPFTETIPALGHGYVSVVTAPTCEAAGYTTYTCSRCEHSYTGDNVAALGHKWDEGKVTTAPGCESTGVKTYTCQNDASHTYTEEVAATGHTAVTDAYVAPTCTATGLTEGSHCSVCGKVLVAQEEIAANGHSYVSAGHPATAEANAYISHVCSVCDAGYDTELTFVGASLTLENALSINYMVPASVFAEGEFTDPKVIFSYGNRIDGYNGKDMRIVVEDYTVYTYTDNSKYYVFECYGITPSQVGDAVTATLYGTFGDETYTHVNAEYGVSSYCYAQLEQSSSKELKTLMVDLLNYSTAACVYTGYKANEPTNAGLTEEQKSYGTTAIPTLENHLNLKQAVIAAPTASWKGASVVLGDTVAIRVRFAVDSLEDVTVKAVLDGQTYVLDSNSFKSAGDGQYYVTFAEMNAYQLRDTVDFTVYKGTEAISNTVRYSVVSYAYAQQNHTSTKLVALLQAMMRYGDAANAYLESK